MCWVIYEEAALVKSSGDNGWVNWSDPATLLDLTAEFGLIQLDSLGPVESFG